MKLNKLLFLWGVICFIVLIAVIMFNCTKEEGFCATSIGDNTNTFIPEYELVCYDPAQGFRMTWEYQDLNQSQLESAYEWAENNNCTLTKLNMEDSWKK